MNEISATIKLKNEGGQFDIIFPITLVENIIVDKATNKTLKEELEQLSVVSSTPITMTYNVQDTDYTIVPTDGVILVNSSTTNIIITLPSALGNLWQQYVIKNIGLSDITVQPSLSQTIDNNALVYIKPYASITIIAANGNWYII